MLRNMKEWYLGFGGGPVAAAGEIKGLDSCAAEDASRIAKARVPQN